MAKSKNPRAYKRLDHSDHAILNGNGALRVEALHDLFGKEGIALSLTRKTTISTEGKEKGDMTYLVSQEQRNLWWNASG